jgi:hypothetical protein
MNPVLKILAFSSKFQRKKSKKNAKDSSFQKHKKECFYFHAYNQVLKVFYACFFLKKKNKVAFLLCFKNTK